MLFDLRTLRSSDGLKDPMSFSNSTFVENPAFGLEDGQTDGPSADAGSRNVLSIEVKSASMSFCDNPIANSNFDESNIWQVPCKKYVP